MAAEEGVRGWRFVQRQGEAVFIPAGCPHQVGVAPRVEGAMPACVDGVSSRIQRELGAQRARLYQGCARLRLARASPALPLPPRRFPSSSTRPQALRGPAGPKGDPRPPLPRRGCDMSLTCARPEGDRRSCRIARAARFGRAFPPPTAARIAAAATPGSAAAPAAEPTARGHARGHRRRRRWRHEGGAAGRRRRPCGGAGGGQEPRTLAGQRGPRRRLERRSG